MAANQEMKTRSFDRFQKCTEGVRAGNPSAHAYTISDFTQAWKKAIQFQIARLDPQDPNFEKNMDSLWIPFRQDNLNVDTMGQQIYYCLLKPKYREFQYRPCAFSWLRDLMDFPEKEEDRLHRGFVETWKDYVAATGKGQELLCFLMDSMDKDLRDVIFSRMNLSTFAT